MLPRINGQIRDDVDVVTFVSTTNVRIWHGFKLVSNGQREPREARIYIDGDCELLTFLECSNDSSVGVVYDDAQRLTFVRKIGSGNHGKSLTINRPNSGSHYIKGNEGRVNKWYNGPNFNQGNGRPFTVVQQVICGLTSKGIKVARFFWPNYPWLMPDILNDAHADEIIKYAQRFKDAPIGGNE